MTTLGSEKPGREMPLEWVGRSRKNLGGFPREVRLVLGQALRLAQQGKMHGRASKMKGHLRDVIEVWADDDTADSTYRVMYTTKIGNVVYVLHAFKKKATAGVSTPKRELDVLETRLTIARTHFKEHYRHGKP